MTTLHVTVGDRAQIREEAHAFVTAGEADDLEDSDQRAVLQFGTYDNLVDNLTPLRLDLLEAIAADAPESMREAARLVDRDVSDVHADLKRLEVLGILELQPGGHGGAKRPVVPFERIELHVEYPLVEDGDVDDTKVNA